LLLCLIFSVSSAYAIDLSGAKIKGNGCETQLKIQNLKNTYVIPLNIDLKKSNTSALERKTCNLRIPIKLQAHQKLIVSEALQNIDIKSVKGTKIEATLKIAIASQKSKEMSIESESEENKKLSVSGLVTESACGKDAMLTTDLSVFATGPAAVSAKLDALSIEMKIVSCK
ncbi:MAG: hypothetical protein ABL930_11685, partial [Pseudobdellovibrio sp.]